MNCRFTEKKQCEKEYGDCEHCRVPNSFGYFWVRKGAKLVVEQRFILERQRQRLIAANEQMIRKLQKEIEDLEAIPGADEYRAKKGGEK